MLRNHQKQAANRDTIRLGVECYLRGRKQDYKRQEAQNRNRKQFFSLAGHAGHSISVKKKEKKQEVSY